MDLIVAVNNIDCRGTNRILGPHKLFLYFMGSLAIQASTSFFTSIGSHVFLIGVGGSTVGDIQIKTGASTAFGFIYAPGKDAFFAANCSYDGAVVARNVSISIGANVGLLTTSDD